VAPGNSIGTLVFKPLVPGGVALTAMPGSVWEIEVDGTGGSDLLDVQGDADLQGGQVQLLGLTGGVLGRQFTFMKVTGAVAGPGFAGVHDPYVFADIRLSSAGGDFSMSVDRNAATFASLGRSDNQRRAAHAIESLGVGSQPYEALIGLQDAQGAPSLYDQFSGELHATAGSMLWADAGLVRSGVMGRLAMGRAGGAPVASGKGTGRSGGHGLWGHVLASWGEYAGAGVSQDASRFSTGFMLGRDLEWSPGRDAGVALGYTRSRVRAEEHNEATLDGFHLTAYGALSGEAWRLRGGVGQSWFTVDTRRNIDAGGLGRQTARYGAWATQAFAELGTALPLGAAVLEPYAGVAQVWQGTQGFSEDGRSPLTGESQRNAFTQSELGVRTHWDVESSSGDLRLMAGVSWLRVWGDLSAQARLSHPGAASYTLSGVPQARDAMQLELKASLAHTRAASLDLGYLGRIGGGVRDHGLRLQASYRF
jgi:subtilase-type serine protease